MGYNLSFEDGVNSTSQLFTGINTSMNGLPTILTLVLVWFFIFLAVKVRGADTLDSFIITNFVTSIVSGLLMFIGLIGWSVALVPFIMLVIGLVIGGYT